MLVLPVSMALVRYQLTLLRLSAFGHVVRGPALLPRAWVELISTFGPKVGIARHSSSRIDRVPTVRRLSATNGCYRNARHLDYPPVLL